MADYTQIKELINEFRVITQKNAVSPETVGEIMYRLAELAESDRSYADAFASTFNNHVSEFNSLRQQGFMLLNAFCDASGVILRSKLPAQVLFWNDPAIKNKLPSDIVYSSSQVGSSQILPAIWTKALDANRTVWNNGSFGYADVDYKSLMVSPSILRQNGYYPDVSPSLPYYAYGVWMPETHAWAMLYDRYTPFDGGTMCLSFCNLPTQPKSSDSRLSLDYAACNNHRPKAVVLGPAGWKETVAPVSMHRAIDNATELRAIIGEISMDRLTKAPYLLFHNCPQLWQFHLANIPDMVETLDLSECSADICTIHHYTVSESSAGVGKIIGKSSLQYLLENYIRDISRSKQLNIVLSGTQYLKAVDILQEVRAAGHDISWITLVMNDNV